MGEEARPRRAMSSQFSRVPSEEGLKRLPRLRERDGPTLGAAQRRSCEGNDRAAGILVRDDYVISRNGTVTREEICPYAICVCIYARPCRATPSISTSTLCIPSLVRACTTHRTQATCAVSTGPRIGIRYVHTCVLLRVQRMRAGTRSPLLFYQSRRG